MSEDAVKALFAAPDTRTKMGTAGSIPDDLPL